MSQDFPHTKHLARETQSFRAILQEIAKLGAAIEANQIGSLGMWCSNPRKVKLTFFALGFKVGGLAILQAPSFVETFSTFTQKNVGGKVPARCCYSMFWR